MDDHERQSEGESNDRITRRQFLTRMGVVMTGIGALAAGVPIVTVFLSPAIHAAKDEWVPIGPLDQFTIGQTTLVKFASPDAVSWSGHAKMAGAWLRRESAEEFVAFSIHCTHLGCPVRWEEGAQLFMCPCHGGVFHKNGAQASGPPEVPLARFPTRIRDGNLEVQPTGIPITSLPE